jgi:hypothetical protein
MHCFPSWSQGASANTQDYFFAPLAPVIRGEGSGVGGEGLTPTLKNFGSS